MSYSDGAWQAIAPLAGWPAFVSDETAVIVYTGAAWLDAGTLLDSLQSITTFGLATTADSATPFAAKLNTALWTALGTGEGGTGDLRLTLNKSGGANILSLLLQSGYAARAENGLVGNDDLALRVSPDGASFLDALTIQRSDGRVAFPQGASGLREQLTGPRTYYVDSVNGDDGSDGLSAGSGAFETIARAMLAALSIDLGINDVTIQCAAGTYNESVYLPAAFVGSGRVTLRGDPAAPSNCMIASSGNCLTVESGGILNLEGFLLDNAGGNCGILCLNGGSVSLMGPVVFGQSGRAHVRVEGRASLFQALSDYEIAGDAPRHLEIIRGGRFICHDQTVTLGGATGRRYRVSTQRLINAGGVASSLPGDVAGNSETQGLAV